MIRSLDSCVRDTSLTYKTILSIRSDVLTPQNRRYRGQLCWGRRTSPSGESPFSAGSRQHRATPDVPSFTREVRVGACISHISFNVREFSKDGPNPNPAKQETQRQTSNKKYCYCTVVQQIQVWLSKQLRRTYSSASHPLYSMTLA